MSAHVFKCTTCGSLYTFEEGKEPKQGETTCCLPGKYEHVPELCRGAHTPKVAPAIATSYNTVTIQVQIEKEGYGPPTDYPEFTKPDLKQITLATDGIATFLQSLKIGNVRAQVYLDDRAIDPSEFTDV
jgi:hypothetical protein